MSTLVPNIADPAKSVGDAPLVKLRIVGDGRAFCRALARNIVRQELISAGLIANPEGCDQGTVSG